jgi:hypothetical protein
MKRAAFEIAPFALREGEGESESEFRLATLPSGVREVFSTPIVWPLAVQRAIAAGLRDVDQLTNIVFFMHHPERMASGAGRALDPRESRFAALSAEWKGYRTLVAPMLKPAVKPAPAPFVVTDKERIANQLTQMIRAREDYWSTFQPDALCVARKLLRSDADDRFFHPTLVRGDECKLSNAYGLLIRRYIQKTFVLSGERCTDFEQCFLKLVGEIEEGVRQLMHEVLRISEDTASAAVRQSPVGKKVMFLSSRARDPRSVYHCYAKWIDNWFPAL